MTVIPGGTNICGVSIGVLALESHFPKPPGHIKNPSSLPFTTSYEIIEGLTVPLLLNNPSPEMIEPLIAAAQRLEKNGVRAITGSCGFLALFQKEIAAAVNVPVFVSSLVQADMIHRMTGRPVGVLTASADLLTDDHLRAVGAGDVPIVIEGMDAGPEFSEVILRNDRDDMDLAKIETELLEAGERLLARAPQTGAILLECTDLPPYAHSLQARLGRPVFDIITLATMVDSAVGRRPFSGFIH
ncbi:aspartate/glutamate racemase family protein [Roseobacter sp. S98]|uniref:aspartate/glutamate racemase family protein n=1 Tax=Roseobacter algicola (ex Choi et al. 2025) (nom. illeg.) TaxID=3092138 RepID=UPI0035C75720